MNKPKLLVVDDTPQDLQLLVQFLKADFQITAATSGEMALKMAEQQTPDLAILDVMMPEMDGYELCKKLKQDLPELVVLFLSANDGIDEIIEGYQVGGSDYIIKPFKPDSLLEQIEDALAHANIQYESTNSASKAQSGIDEKVDSKLLPVVENISLILDCFNRLQLNCSVQCRAKAGVVNKSTSGETSALETELLDRIALMEETIHSHQRRLFININRVSVLVKNMPENEQESEQLKTVLLAMTEYVNLKLELLGLVRKAPKSNRGEVLFPVSSTNILLPWLQSLLSDIEQNLSNNENPDDWQISNIHEQIERAFPELQLSEEQENKILALIDANYDSRMVLINDAKALAKQLDDLIHTIKSREE
ncbi:response regulator [Flocculibacter collagenilyticus]|uniref:response regulator n=1 Tax=Flocculibacter collagenilyticus TaxID=2744479 RepID=UPI0018F745A2|nr:response regulator [Flocculibacter collagenilyticus]